MLFQNIFYITTFMGISYGAHPTRPMQIITYRMIQTLVRFIDIKHQNRILRSLLDYCVTHF